MAELVFLLLEFVFVILVEVILSFCMQVCMLVIVTPFYGCIKFYAVSW